MPLDRMVWYSELSADLASSSKWMFRRSLSGRMGTLAHNLRQRIAALIATQHFPRIIFGRFRRDKSGVGYERKQ
jgi:hypothetical protein